MKNHIATSPTHRIGNLRILTTGAAALLASFAGAGAQIIVSGPLTYAENFNLLGTANQAWVDGTTVPGFFAGINSNVTADGMLQATDGTDTTALSALLNLGTDASDRALGSKTTGTGGFANIAYGVLFQNNSGSPLNITNITYTGELWRTNTTVGNREQFITFTKTSPTLFTDTEPGANAATANVGSFTAIPALNWTAPVQTGNGAEARNGNLAANRLTVSSSPNVTVANLEYFMFRWVDTNLAGTDGYQGIDDFSITFTTAPKIYNLGHSVGGTAPNGVLAVSPALYWLNGTLPVGLASGDSIGFSQNITAGAGTALITAPAAITLGSITLANTIGDYTLQTDADVTTSGFIGTGTRALRKTGAAALVVTGASSGNAGLIFDAGSIRLDSTTGGTLSGPISTTTGVLSTGGITVTGTGTTVAMIGGGATDTTNNTYVGTTTVGTALAASGNLVANKAAGSNAIAGDLVIRAGGTFRYSGNTVGNQIADTSRITIDGGSFGDITAAGTDPTNPGAAETVADVTITANGGNFSTGRAAFTTTGAFRVLAGKALAHRAGSIVADEVEVSATGSIDLDGGSTATPSRLTVGATGLTLTGGTINLNSHASNVAAGSTGSILTLNGDVITVGTSNILDIRTAIMTAAVATVDLGGVDRAFDVSGTLHIGTDALPIPLTNGGLVKNGAGNLTITGSQTLTNLIINGGIVSVGANPPPSPALDGALLEAGSAAAVPEPGSLSLLALGALGVLNRRRRA